LALMTPATAYALGGATPLYAWLFAWLPGVDLFRRPADALFVIVPAAAWLSAQALQAALRAPALKPHWPSVVVIVLLLGHALWLAFGAGWHPVALVWLGLSAAIGAAAIRALRRPVTVARRMHSMLLALIVVDLLIFNVGTSFNAASATKSVPTAKREGALQSAYRLLQPLQGQGIPERSAVFGIGALTNGASAYGLPLVNGYNPWVSADYLQFVGMPAYPLDRVQDMQPTAWAPDLVAPVHDLLGLRWIVAQEAFPGSSAIDPFLQAQRRETLLPRVLNPRNVQRHPTYFPNAEAFARTDFQKVLWLSADAADTACADTGTGTITLGAIDYAASHVRVHYRADAPAWLVVNELDASGWEASVDRAPLPVQRANGIFRAVCVPAGDAVLALDYTPWTLWRAGLRAR